MDDCAENRAHTKFVEPLRYQKAVGSHSLDELQKTQKRLDAIQHCLTTEIADYSFGVVHDLLDEDDTQIQKTKIMLFVLFFHLKQGRFVLKLKLSPQVSTMHQ